MSELIDNSRHRIEVLKTVIRELHDGADPETIGTLAMADILILLVLTGPWLVRGKKGLSGRGGVLMALGVLLPVVFGILTRMKV